MGKSLRKQIYELIPQYFQDTFSVRGTLVGKRCRLCNKLFSLMPRNQRAHLVMHIRKKDIIWTGNSDADYKQSTPP